MSENPPLIESKTSFNYDEESAKISCMVLNKFFDLDVEKEETFQMYAICVAAEIAERVEIGDGDFTLTKLSDYEEHREPTFGKGTEIVVEYRNPKSFIPFVTFAARQDDEDIITGAFHAEEV